MVTQKLENWAVCGYDEYVPLQQACLESAHKKMGITPWMNIDVPGGLYTTLLKYKLIDDPVYETNALKCEWVSNKWWVYRTEFLREYSDKNAELVFHGIDYKAHIFLNGEKIGEHTGMFTQCVIGITEKMKAVNTLEVIFESAPKEMGQVGLTSETYTQKARFNYKWDFCVRMVNIGLYAPVEVRYYDGAKFGETYLNTFNGSEKARLELTIDAVVEGEYCVECTLDDASGYKAANAVKSVVCKKGVNKAFLNLRVKNLQPWHPNGNGKQNLYTMKLSLRRAESEIDRVQKKVGFRKLELVQNVHAPNDSLPYTFVVNGIKTYIKGVNMTPMDMEYGTVSKERYQKYIAKLKRLNVNLVRIWGGGIIETADFYELCDEAGIMVWQDYIQSSSGIDNYPAESAPFLRLLQATCVEAAKRVRNSVSLAVLCGGNELMYKGTSKPVNEQVKAIKICKDVTEKYCQSVKFYPTTPSGPVFSFDENKPENNHDVHGPWTYCGPREHYRLYNKAKYLFHSEFGCDGLANLNVLRTIFGENNLAVCDMDDNDVWRFRGEWWNVFKRDKSIFGDNLDTLENFVKLSQFMQGEGLRYAVEAGRRQNFYCSGSLVWQANEPFPNAACTSLIDYYGEEKLAYHFVRTAYERVLPSLEYDSFTYPKDGQVSFKAYLTAEGEKRDYRYTVKFYNEDKEQMTETFTLSAGEGETAFVKAFSFAAKSYARAVVSVWTEEREYTNEYLFLQQNDSGCAAAPVLELYERVKQDAQQKLSVA